MVRREAIRFGGSRTFLRVQMRVSCRGHEQGQARHEDWRGVSAPKYRSADQAELRAAADRLAAALSDEDEEEIVAEFKKARRAGKAAAR